MPIKRIIPVMLHTPAMILCVMPYYNHKKGCPNFGTKMTCPPFTKRYDEVYDMNKDVYVIYNIFAFGDHTTKMRMLHPDWSQRQVECCLYWQGKARRRLREQIDYFKSTFVGAKYKVEIIPEAMGVNVTATMDSIGHHLQWPPKSVTYQVALAAYKKEISNEKE